jgi:hypothetical protein
MFKKIIGFLFIFLMVSIPIFGMDTYTSPDGKWIALKQFTHDINPTVGVDASDIKIHKFETFLYISDKLISKEISYSNSYRKMLDYKKSNTILPNFTYIKFIIYVDDNPLNTYDFHTNGTGMIVFNSHRWLYN